MARVVARSQRSIRALLLAAVSPHVSDAQVVELASDADIDALADLAEAHGVTPLVAARLSRLGVARGTEVMERLSAGKVAAGARQLQTYRTVRVLAEVLDASFLLVKGPVLAAEWYVDPTLRPYSDIDVVVRRADFASVLDDLGASGFSEISGNWHGFLEHEVAEIPLMHESSTVDLHWHLIALGSLRRVIHFDEIDYFDRSTRVVIGETPVSTLDDEDTLLHLCVNHGLGGTRRLRSIVDVDAVAASDRVDWDEFVTRSRSSRAHGICAAVLQRAHLTVGTPLPDTLLAELSPYPGWLDVNALIDRRRRSGRRLANGVASGILLASGRSTRRATVAAVARATRDAVAIRAGGPGATGPGGALDWQRLPTDGDVDLQRGRYLEWVAHTADYRVERCRDPGRLHRLITHLEPRTTPLLGAARRGGLRSRTSRALLLWNKDRLAAAVVLDRWTLDGWTAFPLILDPGVARSVAELVDDSCATEIAGFESDTLPLAPHLERWRRYAVATPVSLPAGFVWEDEPATTRVADEGDLERVLEIAWRYAPHSYPNRWLLRRWLRKAIADLVLVVEVGEPPEIAGYAARESWTQDYDLWEHLVIDPAYRGRGLSWHLVAAGAAQVAARGVGGLAFVVASNPMSIPVDSLVDDPYTYVALRPPRRFRGEPRIHQLVARVLVRGGRSEPVSWRTTGRDDSRVSTRRSQVELRGDEAE